MVHRLAPSGAPLAEADANLCARVQGTLSNGNLQADFSLDIADLLTALGVPTDAGPYFVAGRMQLIGFYNFNGNTPGVITQLYPFSIAVANGVVANTAFNSTFETVLIPPGFVASPGGVLAGEVALSGIGFVGTVLSPTWLSSADQWLASNPPACEICLAAVTG